MPSGGIDFATLPPLALEHLGARNSETLEWIFRKIHHLSPRDERFLAADDLDIALDVYTWMADQRRSADKPLVSADSATTTDRDGRRREHVRTDDASWEAMLAAAAAGKSGDEIYAAGQAAVSTAAADSEEAERLVREIMGDQYRPFEGDDR